MSARGPLGRPRRAGALSGVGAAFPAWGEVLYKAGPAYVHVATGRSASMRVRAFRELPTTTTRQRLLTQPTRPGSSVRRDLRPGDFRQSSWFTGVHSRCRARSGSKAEEDQQAPFELDEASGTESPTTAWALLHRILVIESIST